MRDDKNLVQAMNDASIRTIKWSVQIIFLFWCLYFWSRFPLTSWSSYSNQNVAVSCRVSLVCIWNQPFKIGVIPFIYVFQKVNCFLLKWYFVQHFPSGFRLTWEHSQCWINCQLMVDGFSFYVFISYRNIWHIFSGRIYILSILVIKFETYCMC